MENGFCGLLYAYQNQGRTVYEKRNLHPLSHSDLIKECYCLFSCSLILRNEGSKAGVKYFPRSDSLTEELDQLYPVSTDMGLMLATSYLWKTVSVDYSMLIRIKVGRFMKNETYTLLSHSDLIKECYCLFPCFLILRNEESKAGVKYFPRSDSLTEELEKLYPVSTDEVLNPLTDYLVKRAW